MTGVIQLILALSILGGCATSQVITNDTTAGIWANGELIGHGQAEIDHFGMPETTRVQVRALDGRGRDLVIKRHVTGFTTLAGILTYGICFLFCWEYPETIVALLPPPTPSCQTPPPSPSAQTPSPPAGAPPAGAPPAGPASGGPP
jgi:hypothetical protein